MRVTLLRPWPVIRAVTVQLENGRWIVACKGSTLFVHYANEQGLSGNLVSSVHPDGIACFLPASAVGCVVESNPISFVVSDGL